MNHSFKFSCHLINIPWHIERQPPSGSGNPSGIPLEALKSLVLGYIDVTVPEVWVHGHRRIGMLPVTHQFLQSHCLTSLPSYTCILSSPTCPEQHSQPGHGGGWETLHPHLGF